MRSFRDFYRTVTNPFGAKGPFYGKNGHHGVDFAAAPGEAIPSFVKAKCVLNGRSSVLGDYTVLKGKVFYHGWSHLIQGTRPDIGAMVQQGQSVGKAAGRENFHGTAWNGSHAHVTRSLFLTGIFDGRTLNPWPAIKKAIAKK